MLNFVFAFSDLIRNNIFMQIFIFWSFNIRCNNFLLFWLSTKHSIDVLLLQFDLLKKTLDLSLVVSWDGLIELIRFIYLFSLFTYNLIIFSFFLFTLINLLLYLTELPSHLFKGIFREIQNFLLFDTDPYQLSLGQKVKIDSLQVFV